MEINSNEFISGGDFIHYDGVVKGIKKSSIPLQPVFEGFTNALEVLRLLPINGEITIKIYQNLLTDGNTEFVRLIIEDNGKGFDDQEFSRFNRYKDFSKGFKNLGSGRIQFVHFFNSTIVKSTFKQDSKMYDREFVISKRDEFIKQNAIVKHIRTELSTSSKTKSQISFSELIDTSNSTYHTLDDVKLKEALISRYLQYFCINRDSFPEVIIEHYIQGELNSTSSIDKTEIPSVEKERILALDYYSISGGSITKLEEQEKFTIQSFKATNKILHSNEIKLTSKDEIIEGMNFELQNISKTDTINDCHYLFLVSSDYIDSRDPDNRGDIQIPTRENFNKPQIDLFQQKEIFLDEIEEKVNDSINEMYPEFSEKAEEHQSQLEKLKDMFLLDDALAKEIKVSLNDSESKILEKFYSHEAKKVAKLDASIKERIDHIDRLDTTSSDYDEQLESEIEKLVQDIPQQNKAALAHYVARRKLVLELFQKILDKKTKAQAGHRNIDEKLLHNLLFQQSRSSNDKSDLWLINEEFIYFNGTSEDQLSKIKINEKLLLRSDLTDEEEKFRKELNENRFAKRPDILLFPEEAKCIIIEFKNPEVNLSDHLNQINNYATLIWNFASSEFKFNTFYGYLIGEKISSLDVRAKDSDFIEAHGFDYMFRPHKPIAGLFDKSKGDASLYTEIIKYSTLLERAKKRNQIFIDKLTKTKELESD